jgi:hypothetical protein
LRRPSQYCTATGSKPSAALDFTQGVPGTSGLALVRRTIRAGSCSGDGFDSMPARAERPDLVHNGTLVRLSGPRMSPDAHSVALVVSRVNYDESRYDVEIGVAPAAGAVGRRQTGALDRNVTSFQRRSGGRSVVVRANDGTSVGLRIQPTDGPTVKVAVGRAVPASDFTVSHETDLGHHHHLTQHAAEPDGVLDLVRRATLLGNEGAAVPLKKHEGTSWGVTTARSGRQLHLIADTRRSCGP